MKRLSTTFAGIFGLIGLAFVITITRSPYVMNPTTSQKEVAFSIRIQAPVTKVYEYLGHSENAAHWSSFVDHIKPTNLEKVSDGNIGSVRRCYQNRDESGLQWDEQTVKNIPSQLRQLTIFNMKGFQMSSNTLRTEQRYTELSPTSCLLTFSLFYGEPSPSIVQELKMHYASHAVHRIFQNNLMNIKSILEGNEGADSSTASAQKMHKIPQS